MVKTLFLLSFLAYGAGKNVTYPEAPAKYNKFHDMSFIKNGHLTQLSIPPVRTTYDGRLGINFKNNHKKYEFYLLRPEAIHRHLFATKAQHIIEGFSKKFTVSEDQLRVGTQGTPQHLSFCEQNMESKKNPYQCGEEGRGDCYDLKVILVNYRGNAKVPGDVEFHTRKLTVRVKNPKTASAKIESIVYQGPPVIEGIIKSQSDRPGNFYALFEPNLTRDGRFLVARSVNAYLPDYPNGQGASSSYQFNQKYDVIYSVYSGGDPCDFSQFKTFRPIAYAHYDHHVDKSLYPFASYPMKDTMGNLIDKTKDVGGSYPWINHDGSLLHMTMGGVKYDNKKKPYDRKSGSPIDAYPNSKHRNHSVMGSWTNGQIVVLDGPLNKDDYTFRKLNQSRDYLLYKDNKGKKNYVSIGNSRVADDTSYLGYTSNTTFFESIESKFNHLPMLKPATPRDVVWIVSNGTVSDEIIFDDYLDRNAFVVSNMVGTMSGSELDGSKVVYTGYDFVTNNFHQEVRIQNAAASSRFAKRPAYGVARAVKDSQKPFVDDGRLEPVALGGIQGKGFWLTGKNYLDYAINDDFTATRSWYYGLFLDRRKNKAGTILEFPAGDKIEFDEGDILRFVVKKTVLSIDVSKAIQNYPHHPNDETWDKKGEWLHLGLRVNHDANDHTQIQVFINGMKVIHDDKHFEGKVFELKNDGLSSKSLKVGEGLVGWIDELRLLAEDGELQNPELICNRARGSLFLLSPNLAKSDPWSLYTGRGFDHESIVRILNQHVFSARPLPLKSKFACISDYNKSYKESYSYGSGGLKRGYLSLRKNILEWGYKNDQEEEMVVGLKGGIERPDFSKNGFCLSCHHNDRLSDALKVTALEYRAGVTAHKDPRRQPSMPLALVGGNVSSFLTDRFDQQEIQKYFIELASGQELVNLDSYVIPDGPLPDEDIRPLARCESDVWHELREAKEKGAKHSCTRTQTIEGAGSLKSCQSKCYESSAGCNLISYSGKRKKVCHLYNCVDHTGRGNPAATVEFPFKSYACGSPQG